MSAINKLLEACEVSGQCVSCVLVHLTGGAVLPVAVTFSLWQLGITVIQCVSRHDG